MTAKHRLEAGVKRQRRREHVDDEGAAVAGVVVPLEVYSNELLS
ncbi:hypothetical protein [Natrinema ejinorense]|nr:hypothetical protein [Natrinema ejinorense]